MTGEPDISYQSIVYIKDCKYVFTHGQLYDASGTSDKLKKAVKINNTDFDGSEDIITEIWGTSREVSITDFSKTNQGFPISVDGSKNIVLSLPKDIDANVTNDSDGNNITETYSTKQELIDSLDELPTFFVYSGEDDSNPTLDTLPASQWTTQAEKESHGGDYYVTTAGRIFQFYEDPKNGWIWKEITDYYLYDCLESLKNLETILDKSTWDNTRTSVSSGSIILGLESSNTKIVSNYIDVLSCNQNLRYNLSSDTTIYLPYLGETSYVQTRTSYFTGTDRLITVLDLGNMVRKQIILYNNSSSATITLMLSDSESITVAAGKVCTLSLSAEKGSSGKLTFIWGATLMDKPNFSW